ncbi:hypothetical protein EZJ58_2236 [Sodalis ligni]|uniref:Uncharacterized protein n=1 Tax=Sodalis ligni TaxID=2697027 RepID=A0A4R1NBH4_9GAMM|nr:hypothetical protein EZJ58_2236 [Sodalis ligni]
MRPVFYPTRSLASGNSLTQKTTVQQSVDSVLQTLAGAEAGHFSRWNTDFFTSLRITTGTGRAFANRKSAEADQCNVISLLQGFGNGTNNCVQCTSGSRFGNISTCGNFVDQL